MGEQGKTFLTKIYEKIESGEYDHHLTIPFMDRRLFFKLIENKVISKEKNNSNPLLTDKEINFILKDLKETSVSIASLYLKLGFIEKKEDGSYELTKKGKEAVRISVLQSVGLLT